MDWRVKGVIQKALGLLPGGAGLNHVLQRTLGQLRDFDAAVDSKVTDWIGLVSYLRELLRPIRGLDVLEVGTGRFPTLPLCFSLAGARSCRTYDHRRHLSGTLTLRMRGRLETHLGAIAEASGRPRTEVEAAYRSLRRATTPADLLSAARVTYFAPADAARIGLPEASVDLVFSNSVLEHVAPPVILAIMAESRRVLRPDGLAVHCANCGDHYAYFDRSITAINYLAYPERAWRFWNNRLLYQNRLRPRDFLELAERAGLEPVLARYTPRPALLEALGRMTLAPQFRAYAPEQLCSTSIGFAARRPP